MIRYITSSCLNSSASMCAAQSASTSGATSIITEDAEVDGERRCVVRIFWYVSPYDGRDGDAR